MNRVTTTSTCGRCGATKVRDGAWLDSSPEGWTWIYLSRKCKANTTSQTLFSDAICPPCQDAVMAVLKPNDNPSTLWPVALTAEEINAMSFSPAGAGIAERKEG